MASLRGPRRKDGTGWAVLYTLNNEQTSATFDGEAEAEEFKAAVNSIGAERAMRAWGINPTKKAAKRSTAPTVAQWLGKYIASRTGVAKSTIYDYESYLRNDVEPTPLAGVPIDILSGDDIADWVQHLEERDLSGKTIANRHGFVSAALNAAVRARMIPVNPAAGTRLPRTVKREMCFLTHDEFDLLLGCFTSRWRPMVRFLPASGARFGEVSALVPSSVDREQCTVRINQGRKRTYDENGYEIGPTKTVNSDRTIDVAKHILDDLDYSGEWLFTNTKAGPVLVSSWRTNVWYPAVAKARGKGLEKQPRIHDMRHTCASWMIAGGADLYAVQRHLGHESISTTIDLYSHLDRKAAKAAADIVGEALRPSKPRATGDT